jgi:hypothetical protein
MKSVRSSFGGTAAGEVDTYLGSLQQMKNEFGEVAEAIGESNGILDVMTQLNKNLKNLATSLKTEVPSALEVVKDSFKRLADNDAVKPFIAMFSKISELSTKTAIAINKDGDTVIKAKKDASKEIIDLQKKQSNTEIAIAAAANKSIAKGYRDAVAQLKEAGLDWKKFFLDVHAALTDSLAGAFTDMALEGKNFGDAMGNLWANLKTAVIQILAQMVAQAIVQFMLMGTTWTSIMTWMIGAWNTFLAALGPIGWIILAIIALFTLLKDNWEQVTTAFTNGWKFLEGILQAFLDLINSIIDAVKKLIESIEDVFSFDLPTLGELSDQLSFKLFAGGVRNFAGGMAVVGEQGPELVRLPTGSNVYSNQESRNMVSEFRTPKIINGNSAGNISIVINATVRSDEDWERVTRNKIIPSLERYMRKTAVSPFA